MKPPRLRAPLVGREHELEVLEANLAEAVASKRPQTVTLVGAAGVGKSRLLREFLTNVRTRDDAPRVLRVMSRGEGAALAPIRALLRDRFGIPDGTDDDTAAAAFRTGVAGVIGEDSISDFLHFLGTFVGLRLPDSPLVQAVGADAEQLRRVQRAVLSRFLELDAARGPLVLAFEDFHRAHADSIDLLKHVVSSLQTGPIMVVFVARPELTRSPPDWTAGDRHLRFELNPLDQDDAALLFSHLLSRAPDVPDDLIDAAVDLAAGNPYLLEQLVRAFIEQAVVVPAPGAWQVHPGRLDETQLPLTVDDAIESRIGGLRGEERALLERAAALGGVFWSGALVALGRAGQSPPGDWHSAVRQRAHVERVLDDLIASDYLLSIPDSTIPGEREYAFKHNLERESLHRNGSASLQREYHLHIARWLECRLSSDNEEHCALLAQHYEQGGEGARAARYYLAAARRAQTRYAPARACEYLADGLRLLPEPVSLRRLDALERHGRMLHQRRRPGEALKALTEAKRLAYQLDLPGRAARVYLDSGRAQRDEGRLPEACLDFGTARALYDALGEAGPAQDGAQEALLGLASAELLRGRFESAEGLIREALGRLRARPSGPATLGRWQLALGKLCREVRRFEEADRAFAQALASFRKAESPMGLAEALCLRGVVAGQRGQPTAAEALLRQGLDAARETGDRARQVIALTCLGAAHYRRDELRSALALLQQAVKLSAGLGDRLQQADTLRSFAQASALSGNLRGAFEAAERARMTFELAGAQPQLGVALRTSGEILARGDWPGKPERPTAEDYFERSIAIFDETRNRAEQARSYNAYASLLSRPADVVAQALGAGPGLPEGRAQRVERERRFMRAEAMRARALSLLGQEPAGNAVPGPPEPDTIGA